MSENFFLYFGVLSGFAIKTNFSFKEKNTFSRNFVYSYLSIGALSVFLISFVTIIIINQQPYSFKLVTTLMLYAFLFFSKDIILYNN